MNHNTLAALKNAKKQVDAQLKNAGVVETQDPAVKTSALQQESDFAKAISPISSTFGRDSGRIAATLMGETLGGAAASQSDNERIRQAMLKATQSYQGLEQGVESVARMESVPSLQLKNREHFKEVPSAPLHQRNTQNP